MKKVRFHWLVIGLILLVVFNFAFFLIDFDRRVASVWISYAFIHLAYLQLIAVPFLIPQSQSTHSFIESTSAVSAIYLLVELVLGTVFILLALEEWKIVLLTQLVLLIISMLILYATILTNKRTANTEYYEKQAQKTMKSAGSYLQQAKQFVEGGDKAAIDAAYYELKASPLLVDENIRGLENNILTGCKSILDLAQAGQHEEMRKQIALVSQLICLRKNSEI